MSLYLSVSRRLTAEEMKQLDAFNQFLVSLHRPADMVGHAASCTVSKDYWKAPAAGSNCSGSEAARMGELLSSAFECVESRRNEYVTPGESKSLQFSRFRRILHPMS